MGMSYKDFEEYEERLKRQREWANHLINWGMHVALNMEMKRIQEEKAEEERAKEEKKD